MAVELLEAPATPARKSWLPPSPRTVETTGRLEIPVETATGEERVALEHTLPQYMRGAYLQRVKSYEKSTKRAFPIPYERVRYLRDFRIHGITRGNFTVVFFHAMDGEEYREGVGFAKRSLDSPRIERGTSIAFYRAMDDLIRGMAFQVLESGNGSGS
jgi:hypothetical protein